MASCLPSLTSTLGAVTDVERQRFLQRRLEANGTTLALGIHFMLFCAPPPFIGYVELFARQKGYRDVAVVSVI